MNTKLYFLFFFLLLRLTLSCGEDPNNNNIISLYEDSKLQQSILFGSFGLKEKCVNSAFALVRQLIPTEPPDRKLSKIETLRLASSYIAHLQCQLMAGAGDQPCLRLQLGTWQEARLPVCTFCLASQKKLYQRPGIAIPVQHGYATMNATARNYYNDPCSTATYSWGIKPSHSERPISNFTCKTPDDTLRKEEFKWNQLDFGYDYNGYE